MEATKNNTREIVEGLISENKINPTTFKMLSEDLNIPYKTLKWYYYKLRVKNNEGSSNVPIKKSKVITIKRLEMSIKEINKEYFLYVKSCEDFEKYLKENKELSTTQNLFGEEKTGKYYRLRFTDRNILDNINKPIFYMNRINFSILRSEGISKGINFKIDSLITKTTLQKEVNLLGRIFKAFFEKEIEKIPIDINLEVVSEITQKEVLN